MSAMNLMKLNVLYSTTSGVVSESCCVNFYLARQIVLSRTDQSTTFFLIITKMYLIVSHWNKWDFFGLFCSLSNSPFVLPKKMNVQKRLGHISGD